MDKKGGIGLLLGLGKPSADEEAEDDDTSESSAAGQAVLDAIESKDAKALIQAIRLCCED